MSVNPPPSSHAKSHESHSGLLSEHCPVPFFQASHSHPCLSMGSGGNNSSHVGSLISGNPISSSFSVCVCNAVSLNGVGVAPVTPA